MKIKRYIAFFLVIVFAACLFMGCGTENTSKSDKTTSAAAQGTTGSADSSEVPFETKEMISNDSVVATNIFKVTKPEGWTAIRQYDRSDEPVNGLYPVDETKLCITKGGKEETDVYELPTVFVYYEDSAVKMEDIVQWYNDYQMLDDTIINGVACETCLAAMESYFDTDVITVYGIVLYPISENETIEFTVTVEYPDGSGVAMDDPDVVTIMNSVELVK